MAILYYFTNHLKAQLCFKRLDLLVSMDRFRPYMRMTPTPYLAFV